LSRAFTLIELLTVLTIVGLLAFITASAVESISFNAKTWLEPKRLFSLIQQTRSLAISSEQDAVLCPSANTYVCVTDWELPIIQFLDINNNKKRDQDEPLISRSDPYQNIQRQIQYRLSQIRFDREGQINGYTGTLKYCTSDKTTGIVLSRVGRIRYAQDLDGDGIPDIEPNKPVVCTINL